MTFAHFHEISEMFWHHRPYLVYIKVKTKFPCPLLWNKINETLCHWTQNKYLFIYATLIPVKCLWDHNHIQSHRMFSVETWKTLKVFCSDFSGLVSSLLLQMCWTWEKHWRNNYVSKCLTASITLSETIKMTFSNINLKLSTCIYQATRPHSAHFHDFAKALWGL